VSSVIILATARCFQSGIGRLPSTQLNDEQIDFKIPLRTGCDDAALGVTTQMAAGVGGKIALRICPLSSVQNAASRVSVVNSSEKGGDSLQVGKAFLETPNGSDLEPIGTKLNCLR
jgi:hypothetical protein